MIRASNINLMHHHTRKQQLKVQEGFYVKTLQKKSHYLVPS